MTNKLTFKWQILLSSLIALFFVGLFLILRLTNVISLAWFIVLIVLTILGLICALIPIILKRKEELKRIAILNAQKKARENKLIELYKLMGVDLQYNEDGTIKDLFQLLNLPIKFDENGKRIITVYELLKIAPMFTKDGKEIPNIFIIKNRVKSFAKSIAEPLMLTYKPAAQKQADGKVENPVIGKEQKADKKDPKAAAKPKIASKAKAQVASQSYSKQSKSAKAKTLGKVSVSKSPTVASLSALLKDNNPVKFAAPKKPAAPQKPPAPVTNSAAPKPAMQSAITVSMSKPPITPQPAKTLGVPEALSAESKNTPTEPKNVTAVGLENKPVKPVNKVALSLLKGRFLEAMYVSEEKNGLGVEKENG